jgi:DNA-binding transcriptional LysR family regulator
MRSNADVALERYGQRMIDARRLVVLRAIAEHRSFTRAAEALSLTQPAVSRQLAALEREAGVALVARGPRHVSLTPAGAALAAEADAILAALDAAGRRMRGFAAPDGGAVRVGAVPSALAGFVPAALAALRAQRPRVEIEAVEGWSADLARRTARGDLDLAIVAGAGAGEVLVHEPFAALLPAAHALAARRRMALADLAGEPWIVAPEPGGRQAVLAACAAAGFAPHVAATAGWDATPGLIAAGLGVALAPRATAARLGRRAGVVARALTGAPERELRLIRPPRARRTAVERDLERHLRELATTGRRRASRR